MGQIQFLSGLIDEQASGFNFHSHIGKKQLNSLESANRFAKLLAFASILAGSFKGSLRYADRNRSDIHPTTIERGQSNLQTLAFLADALRGWDCTLGENQFAGRRRM